MKLFLLALLTASLCLSHARAEEDPLPQPNLPGYKPGEREPKEKPWYRDAGDYLSSRSVRMGVPTDTNTKVITDAKRFDVSLGKRISLFEWSEKGPAETWAAGIDGGMLASLTRYKKGGQLTFATNTFDGFFGAWIGYIGGGWLTLFRYGHLSAHMVDSNSDLFAAKNYSQFWGEIIAGKTFPIHNEESDWEVHLQGSVGMNHTSAPAKKQPRATLGTTVSYSPWGPDSVAFIGSADALRAGVTGQKNSYSFFTGIGSINRPSSKHRPYRVGLAHFAGSDYRNQYYYLKQKWTTFEISTEF